MSAKILVISGKKRNCKAFQSFCQISNVFWIVTNDGSRRQAIRQRQWGWVIPCAVANYESQLKHNYENILLLFSYSLHHAERIATKILDYYENRGE